MDGWTPSLYRRGSRRKTRNTQQTGKPWLSSRNFSRGFEAGVGALPPRVGGKECGRRWDSRRESQCENCNLITSFKR
jgi:hypothetical protein